CIVVVFGSVARTGLAGRFGRANELFLAAGFARRLPATAATTAPTPPTFLFLLGRLAFHLFGRFADFDRMIDRAFGRFGALGGNFRGFYFVEARHLFRDFRHLLRRGGQFGQWRWCGRRNLF